MKYIDSKIEDTQIIPLLDVSLQAAPLRWWGTHYNRLQNW